MFLTQSPGVMELPGAAEILAFQENEADNFLGVPGFDWGFFGLDATHHEEVIEDVPGRYRRTRRISATPAGDFTAIIRHTHDDLSGAGDPNDYFTEKHFIETLDDFRRLVNAPRAHRPFDPDAYNRGCAKIGGRGVPITGLFHPLGNLARSSTLDEAYAWLLAETELMEAFLERCTEQICDSLLAVRGAALADPPVFKTHALEMFIPPWLGKELFRKWVFTFDKRVNDAVHAIGGRHFAHCHGNSGGYLELFAEMGLDAVDPLEPPPYGDNNLALAKRQVGGQMLLCGNIPSQVFYLDVFKPGDVRELVRRAIEEGAPGGGFSLRTTGSAHIGNGKSRAQKAKAIQCGLAMIDAWREFGTS
jgi:hypothetical protein